MYLMLFADDIVLFTTDPISLQAQIDSIYQYSSKWGLRINVNNIEICIFEKRKQNHGSEFFIENHNIDIVDNLTYLGINFKYNSSLANAVKALHEQALHAYYNICYIFDELQCNIKMKLSLFDKMIVPILLHGSEVWGTYGYKEIDTLHLQFCKRILNVKQQTRVAQFMLSNICTERSLKYWLCILKSPNSRR